MPLTPKGAKVKKSMERTYGKKKGDEVFYKSVADPKIKGAKKASKKGKK